MSPADYIGELFEPKDRIAIVLISRSDEGRVLQRIMDAGDAASDKYQGWFRHMNARETDPRKPVNGRPWDLYIGMNRLEPHARGRTKEDIAEVKHVFLDIDKDGAKVLEKIRQHPAIEQPHYVIGTSPDKYQAVWRVQNFDKEKAEVLCRNMAAEFGADPARIDISSVLRLPGFKNGKYPEMNHYVTVQRFRNGVADPGSFPRELFNADRQHERVEHFNRSRGPQRDIGEDQSRKDFGYACNALRRGRDPEEIAHEIDQYRQGEKHREYGQRTVRAAQKVVERDVRQERYR